MFEEKKFEKMLSSALGSVQARSYESGYAKALLDVLNLTCNGDLTPESVRALFLKSTARYEAIPDPKHAFDEAVQ